MTRWRLSACAGAVLLAIAASVDASSVDLNNSLITSSGVSVFSHSPSLTPSPISPTPFVTPTLQPSPRLSIPTPHVPPAMSLAPIVFLVAVPVALCLLLVIMVSLICCIICCYQLRRRRKRRQNNKSQGLKTRSSASRLDRSKSLEAYDGNGRSSHSVAKPEESTQRYELQTVDSGGRFSQGSLSSPTTHSSKTLPAASRNHASGWSSNPHIFSGQSTSPHHHPHSYFQPGSTPPQHSHTSPLHSQSHTPQRLHGIPESGIPNSNDKYVMMTKQSKAASLPHSYADGSSFDPSSLYDVPASARGKGVKVVPDPNNPHSVYDTPRGLIASSHYNVPPLAQSVPLLSEGIYDVPPSSAAIYDVPPDTYRQYNPESELYDVPPPTGTRPRLNSQPMSQEELLEARRSILTASDSVFTTEAAPDLGHYDVPRHLLSSQPDMTPYQQPGKRLSRRNSSPSHPKNSMIYDVPRDARMAAPPTAAKPYRNRTPPSRSHSITSPPNMASPERRPYLNEVLYDVPPLDPEYLATHFKQSQTSTSNESDTSYLTRTAGHKGATSPQSAGKSKVPPPTKRKPGKREEGVGKS